MPSELWLADTNILIRWMQPEDSNFPLVLRAIDALLDKDITLCYTLQNLAEFWNAMTRPSERNGYGFSPSEADARAKAIEKRFRFLPDDVDVYSVWRRLVVVHAVRGVQVHDARLVASMQVHSVTKILTFNTRDFARYTQIEAIHPAQVPAT